MIGKGVQAITAIAIPALSTGCVLASAGHLLNIDVATSGQTSTPHVILLACLDYVPDPHNLADEIACQYSDGCPPSWLDAEKRDDCLADKAAQSVMTPGPSPSDIMKPFRRPPTINPAEPGRLPEIIDHLPRV